MFRYPPIQIRNAPLPAAPSSNTLRGIMMLMMTVMMRAIAIHSTGNRLILKTIKTSTDKAITKFNTSGDTKNQYIKNINASANILSGVQKVRESMMD